MIYLMRISAAFHKHKPGSLKPAGSTAADAALQDEWMAPL